MKLKIHFYKQQKPYTCGPAVMRMLLSAFKIKKSESQLEKEMHTFKLKGTPHKSFPELAEKYKLNFVISRNNKIKDIKAFMKKYILIIAYNPDNEETGHFAIVKSLSLTSITLLDPYYGHNHHYPPSGFQRIWHDGEGNKGWMMAVKK